ncbi:alpha/beta fold hydrolase [Anaerosphaera multitolerans]|uniref:Alpha/beta hydrolase n=1 Tax=Anaerosphaera multitolerans TaxID=2487351 RepID=A0A437S4K7_9FIRM|nr:alpha/beta hydrolase [Anaerosphaera multitolerans]RVU53887.1 alpha/beta hydrolase [Anaerosphaera multitolerans]
MDKNFILTSGNKVHYWIKKKNIKADTIVFTHGLTGDHSLFKKQIDLFSKDFNIITWDMPLHGLSIPYKDFSLRNAAKDLKLILEKENIQKVNLVGQSAGGFVNQAFVQMYPENVVSFIALGSTPFGEKYYKNSELFWSEHYSEIASLIPYKLYCSLSAKASCVSKEGQSIFYDCLLNLGKQNMKIATKAYYEDFRNYNEVKFNCPVLLLVGQYDKIGYVKRYNKMWAKKTNYPLIMIPKAGHGANLDNPSFFNKTLENFLKEKDC